MWRSLSALCLFGSLGCANPARMDPTPHLDFGLGETPDLSVAEEPDLAVASDVDLARVINNDLASADLTRPIDLQPQPSCDDAGTTGHLFLSGVGAANALLTASFAEGAGWTAYQ